jgi:protein involved in ribonucleotide reduction
LCNAFPKDPKINNSIKRIKEPIYKMQIINNPVNHLQLFPKRIKIEEPKIVEIKCEEEKEIEQDFIMINYDHGARTKVITEYIPKNCSRYVDNGKLTDTALQKIIDDLR